MVNCVSNVSKVVSLCNGCRNEMDDLSWRASTVKNVTFFSNATYAKTCAVPPPASQREGALRLPAATSRTFGKCQACAITTAPTPRCPLHKGTTMASSESGLRRCRCFAPSIGHEQPCTLPAPQGNDNGKCAESSAPQRMLQLRTARSTRER